MTIGQGFGLAFLVALITSCLVSLFTYFFFKLYLHNVRRAFESGREYQLENQKDMDIQEYSPNKEGDESDVTIDDDGLNDKDFSFDDISSVDDSRTQGNFYGGYA
jgi:hypothetical protein